MPPCYVCRSAHRRAALDLVLLPTVEHVMLWLACRLSDRRQRTAGARLVELSTIGCEQSTTLWKTPVAVPLREGVGVDLTTQRWSDASSRSFFRRSPPAARRWAVAPSVRVRAARSAGCCRRQ
eukprot:4973979-Prymnesium_polylepis.1